MSLRPRLSFSNRALELSYRAAQTTRLARIDPAVYITNSCLWLLGSVWLTLRYGGSCALLFYGLLGALAWLAPWILCRQCPELYARHRNWWVAAVGLGTLFLPTLTTRLQHEPPPQHRLPASTASLVSSVVLAARLPHMWGTALGLLRSDMTRQLAVYTLQSAHLALKAAPRFCRTNYMNNSETLQRFWAMSHELNEWAGLVLPWQPSGRPARADEPAVHHCVAVAVMGQLIFGYFLCSVAVYVSERRSRAEFLSHEAAARGLGLAQAGEQLGLPAQEVMEVCLFDPLTEWLRWAVLLPPLAAAMWLAVSSLVPRVANEPPDKFSN